MKVCSLKKKNNNRPSTLHYLTYVLPCTLSCSLQNRKLIKILSCAVNSSKSSPCPGPRPVVKEVHCLRKACGSQHSSRGSRSGPPQIKQSTALYVCKLLKPDEDTLYHLVLLLLQEDRRTAQDRGAAGTKTSKTCPSQASYPKSFSLCKDNRN